MPKRILVVEDDATIRDTLGFNLKKEGYQVAIARDGAEALTQVRSARPDLVLLDLMLPGLDGRAVLAGMRSDPALRDIPVVVMTGTMAEPADDGGKALDVQGFLTKPVDLKKFLGLVEQLKDFWKADMILPSAGQTEAPSAAASDNL